MSHLLVKLKENPSEFTMEDKQALIIEYTPLIRLIAQKIAVKLPSNIDLNDLISSGVIGLMDAIEKYDPSRDNQFKTYAEFRIRGAILDELRAQDWVPRSIREKSKILNRAYQRLEQKHGRRCTVKEVARELKMNLSQVHNLLKEVAQVSFVDIDEDVRQFPFQDRKTILGMLQSMRSNNPHFQANLKDIRKHLQMALRELSENERLVMSLYYYEELNLKEIGAILGVTESRVSQIHSQAVENLGSRLKKYLGEISE